MSRLGRRRCCYSTRSHSRCSANRRPLSFIFRRGPEKDRRKTNELHARLRLPRKTEKRFEVPRRLRRRLLQPLRNRDRTHRPVQRPLHRPRRHHGTRNPQSHQRPPRRAMIEILFKKQRIEAGLAKMVVRCESVLQSAILHNDKRRAIGQTPALVGSGFKQFQTGKKQLRCGRSHCYGGVLAKSADHFPATGPHPFRR